MIFFILLSIVLYLSYASYTQLIVISLIMSCFFFVIGIFSPFSVNIIVDLFLFKIVSNFFRICPICYVSLFLSFLVFFELTKCKYFIIQYSSISTQNQFISHTFLTVLLVVTLEVMTCILEFILSSLNYYYLFPDITRLFKHSNFTYCFYHLQ